MNPSYGDTDVFSGWGLDAECKPEQADPKILEQILRNTGFSDQPQDGKGEKK